MAQSSDAHNEHVEVPEKRVATPERHLQETEDSGLCPVQPGLQATFEREDLAPETVEASYDSREAKCDAYTHANLGQHASALPKHWRRRRWCGLKRKKFLMLCGLVALIIVIGAVLGGILGARNDHTSVSPSPASQNPSSSTSTVSAAITSTPAIALVEAMKYSGLAAIPSSNQQSILHMYWQDTRGNIIEGDFSNTNFTKYNQTTVIDNSAAKAGTPLSVIGWPTQSLSRILFYVGVNNSVMAIQKTANGWMRPYDILDGSDEFASNGIALATCADSSFALNGIRLYYASENGKGISEASGDLRAEDQNSGTLHWRVSQNFFNTDATSGVGCTISGTILRIYVRSTSDVLEARRWDFTTADDIWQSDASGPTIKAGASIIALSSSNFDRVVWQRAQDGRLELDRNADAKLQYEQETDEAIWQSKISMVANSTGVLVLYQRKTDQTRISYKEIDLGSLTDSEGNVIKG